MFELGFWKLVILLCVGTICGVVIGRTLIELTHTLLSYSGSVAVLLIVLAGIRRMFK